MSTPGSVIPLLLGSTATTYNVERSLRFNSSDSAKCARTYSTGSSTTTQTFSAWVKRAKLGATGCFWSGYDGSAAYGAYFQFDSADTITVILGGASLYQLTTTQVFRDPSSWYHIVLTIDTNNGTSSDRIRLYVNGSRVTTFSTASYPTSGYACQFAMGNANNTIGTTWGSSGYSFFDGYLADVHFIDGQALTPSSFTEVSATTGQLIPKAYTGSFGTNGFWLKFSDNSAATATTLGKDYSGNSNNWTPNNLSVTAGAGNDSLVDTPVSGSQVDTGLGGQVTGNYATFNPINLTPSSSHSLTNGNLEVIGGTGWTSDVSTFPTGATGKWYAEITLAGTFATAPFIGIAKNTSITSSYIGSSSDSYGYRADATKWNGGSSAYGATYTAGDTIGIAYDADAGTLVFYKNGASQGTAYSGLSGSFFIGGSFWTSSTTVNAIANFGQRPFAYPVSGFKALCDTNLPAPVVAKGSTVMDTVLWTGNNTGQTITLPGAFSPDLIWTKMRNAANNHWLFDVIRGANQGLSSSSTTNELTRTDSVTAFGSSGFTLGTSADVNSSAYTYVAWCWDAGTSTVTNTQGSITSQVRANASAGFSICTFTTPASGGFSFGHGLGVAPAFVTFKFRNVSSNWYTYHTALGQKYINLNGTGAAATNEFTTAPTSTIFTYPSSLIIGGNEPVVAYCWAPVAGYSSFGSYTGNGSTDGPFVFTGMRPRWVLFKSTAAGTYWGIYDAARNTYNAVNLGLYPNDSIAELVDQPFDFLSNGFKVRGTTAFVNSNGSTYIYAAFAENPFQYARAR